MVDDNSYDVRGHQYRIFRLFNFDKEGLIHMLFYRMAVFVAFALAASMIIGMFYEGTPFINMTKVLILIIWILFTMQVFETFKAASVIASKGIVFGHLNPSFVQFAVKKRASYVVLWALPYIALAVWALGFVGIVYGWFA